MSVKLIKKFNKCFFQINTSFILNISTIHALKSYKKALVTICNAVETHQLPLNIEAYQQLIEEKIYQVTKQHEFIPIYLPMTSEAELIVKRFHSDYFFEPETLTDDYIIHHHKLRDRSAVKQARILAKKKKSHNKDFSD